MRARSSNMCTALAITVGLCLPASVGAQSTVEVVFQSDRDGNDTDIWIVDSGGGREEAVTTNDTPDASPSWSPDGKTIVYACAPDDNWELCTVDPVVGTVTQLTRTAAHEFDPRYTADGTKIVLETYTTNSRADIAIMPADGGVPKRLTSTSGVDDQDPAPEPGSTRIAFASGGRIAVLDTTSPRRVTRVTGAGSDDTDPSFSIGDEIAFASMRRRSYDIVVAGPASRGRATRRIATGSQRDLEPAWTADGKKLFFARSSRGRGLRIFVTGATGKTLRAVTKGGADYDDAEPAPQPGGGAILARALHVPVRLVAPAASRAPVPRADLLAVAALACTKQNTINDPKSGGNPNLNGTSKAECINGGNGNDRITGFGAGDKLSGGTDDDRLHADDGYQDTLAGDSGSDQCWADFADDVDWVGNSHIVCH